MGGSTTIKSSQAAVIDRDTPIHEIAHQLTARGCKNLTSELNPLSLTTQPIANGGFGDVYRGELLDGRRVAIKTLRLPSSSEPEENVGKLLKRAARELYVWSKCSHPNVLPLLGLVEFHNQLRMVSLWMDHGNLPSYLARNPHLDRHSMSVHVCEGLAYLHHIEIVHGDLKGSNVLVSTQGIPMINDFGNAVHHGTLAIADTTQKNCNTPQWTAPEVMDERESGNTREADVYSLGMTILETITGKIPYCEKKNRSVPSYVSLVQVIDPVYYLADHAVYIAKVLKKEIPTRPEEYISSNTKYGNALWSLLKSCWADEPKERPSVPQVAERMGALMLGAYSNLPVASRSQAAPTSTPHVDYSIVKSSKRPYEQFSPALTPKRSRYESRPDSNEDNLLVSTFPSTRAHANSQLWDESSEVPATTPTATVLPQPPSTPVSPSTISSTALQPQTSSPPPAQPPTLPPSQPPPPMAQPNVPPASQINSQILHYYRQIHLALCTPTASETSRHKLLSSGFRIDPSGQLIGGAGVVLDARGEPGVGATVSPKVHAMAFERARAAAAQAGIARADVGGVGGVNPRQVQERILEWEQSQPCQSQVQVQPSQQSLSQTAGIIIPQTSRFGVPQKLSVDERPGVDNGRLQMFDPAIIRNPNLSSNAYATQNLSGQQKWSGQISYPIRDRDGWAPLQAHFYAIATGGYKIKTNKWPPRLVNTGGFKAVSPSMAAYLYSSWSLPSGQIIVHPSHSKMDEQRHEVFHKIIAAGYSIFYEFHHDLANPLLPTPQSRSAYGLLFFKTHDAPNQVLFKAFIDYACPLMFRQGGQPVTSDMLIGNADADAELLEEISQVVADIKLYAAEADFNSTYRV